MNFNNRLYMNRAYIKSLYAKRAKVAGTINELRKVLPQALDRQFVEKQIKLEQAKLIQIENEIYKGGNKYGKPNYNNAGGYAACDFAGK